MTLEEKLIHLQEISIKQAREHGNELLEEHAQTLDKMYEEYKQAKEAQFEIYMKAEKTNVEQSINKALAYEQLKIKKEVDQKQMELKEQLLEELRDRLTAYKGTKEYYDLLVSQVKKAKEYAKDQELKVYIDPSDSGCRDQLQRDTGCEITVSDRSFFGGIRAVVPARNVLMDESFEARLRNIFSDFIFKGGYDRGC